MTDPEKLIMNTKNELKKKWNILVHKQSGLTHCVCHIKFSPLILPNNLCPGRIHQLTGTLIILAI